MKKILYIDMDNVLVDFSSGIARISDEIVSQYEGDLDEVPGIFALMDPMPGAIEAFLELSAIFDTYILSTSPWENPSAWADKLLWVKKYLNDAAYKRLILTHHKNLNIGDFLVDDRKKRGADMFSGELLLFGPDNPYPNWSSVLDYLRGKAT